MISQANNLRFLHGSHRPRCIASVDKRFDYHTLQLMTRGTVELAYGQNVHRLEGGWAWPAFPGPTIRFHEWPRGRPWDHRYIAFEGTAVALWAAAGLLPQEPVCVSDREKLGRLCAVFDDLLRHTDRVSKHDHLRAFNALERLLIELADLAKPTPEDGSSPAWLEPVLEALQDWASEPDYAELAERVGMSASTLRRRFRRATGVTLHAYRINARIAAARHLLGETDESIKAIAWRLGYRDLHYFSRQFTQVTGISPGRFRTTRQG